MGCSSYNCLVCGRDLMSKWSHKGTPEWMRHVVVYMPDGLELIGEYTAYQAVETGETLISKSISKRLIDRKDDWSGISPILFEEEFDKEAADDDHGYMSLHMWRSSHLYNPCCYHRSCWEAVGKPRGFLAPSLHSIEQGSGSGARMYGPVSCVEDEGGYYDDGRDEGPTLTEPQPGAKAIHLWAVNSVCYFFYQLACWAGAEEYAQKNRDMWASFAETKTLMAEIKEELAKP